MNRIERYILRWVWRNGSAGSPPHVTCYWSAVDGGVNFYVVGGQTVRAGFLLRWLSLFAVRIADLRTECKERRRAKAEALRAFDAVASSRPPTAEPRSSSPAPSRTP